MDDETRALQIEIDSKLFQINQLAEDIKLLVSSLQNKVINNRSNFKSYVPVMLRKIMQYIGRGDTELMALEMVSQEYDYPLYRLRIVWDCAKQQKKALNMYAKAFTAQKMTAEGYSKVEISEVLKLSVKSVIRLLKCEILV